MFNPFLMHFFEYIHGISWSMATDDWLPSAAICQVAHRQQDTQQGPLKVDRMGVSLEALMTGVIQPLKELVSLVMISGHSLFVMIFYCILYQLVNISKNGSFPSHGYPKSSKSLDHDLVLKPHGDFGIHHFRNLSIWVCLEMKYTPKIQVPYREHED